VSDDALSDAVDAIVDALEPTIAQAAKDLGVPESEVARWVANELKARS
jgi:hypothetical protein